MWVPKGLERVSDEAQQLQLFHGHLSKEAERLDPLSETLFSWLGLRTEARRTQSWTPG